VNEIKGHRLHVKLGASQVRRRIKGLGFGIRKVQSAGRGEAVIIHTATGQHLRELQAIFQDVMERDRESDSSQTERQPPPDRSP
jgi:preprotein translocase subunit SecF